MFRRGAIHFVFACALLAPSAASAQEPVRVDPDSPAGVEYKLPLDQARRDGDGAQSGGGSRDPAPLFGAGITRDGSQPGGGGGEDASRGDGEESEDSGDSGAPSAGGGEGAGPGATDSRPSFSAAVPASGGSWTGLTLGGIALAVVVVGTGLGLGLRRGLRTTPAS